MANIFISYNRHTVTITKALVEDVEALGHTVWFDQELSGGQAWWDQILSTIRRCDLFVFVLDPAALNSVACKREYGYAADLRKPILPILVSEGVSTNLLPPSLSQIQFVDYRTPDRTALARLAKALIAIPPPVAPPDPLPVPPEAPISYLGSLAAKVEATSLLTYEEQSVLVFDLKRGLRDPETTDDTRTLLKTLRKRRDLFAGVAEEIDELFHGLREASSAQDAPPKIEKSFAVVEEKAGLPAMPVAPSPESAAVRPPEAESKELPKPSESIKPVEPKEPKEIEADRISGAAPISIRAKPSGFFTPAGKWVRQNPTIAVVVALSVALAAGLGVMSWSRGREKASPFSRSWVGKSVAVLPFENLSDDSSNAYIAKGIQEEIFTRLAAIADLKVISGTSTQHYKSAPTNLREIATELGVANVLEGSVQKSANRAHINVQLINAQTDAHLWADTFDRELIDISSIASEIAKSIADLLGAKLTAPEMQALAAAKPTDNPEAYDAYLRGLAFEASGQGEEARSFYERALSLDPHFAAAGARLNASSSEIRSTPR